MAQTVIDNVQTKAVGFAPILKHYFDKCRIAEIIDGNVPLDPRRKVLSHGQASVAMITGILFQVLQLYRLCKFADETTVLETIFPDIAPGEYFDDRLADTLDAIFDYGIGDLETLLTQAMIKTFQIETSLCHGDTTSASVYGKCDKNRTANSIKITFGHSKKHRDDLKQLVWSLAVSSDSAFPLFQKAYSGNTADVTTYVEQWHNLIDLLGYRDFLYVADSKVVTAKNMAHIHDNEGYFIAPVPMYESYKTAFYDALDNHNQETLLPYKEKLNRGFEIPFTVTDENKEYLSRIIILYDHGLFDMKRSTLQNRVEKTKSDFAELQSKLNKYNLKTEESIRAACESILKKRKSADFFEFRISNQPVISYKNAKRGKPSKNKENEQVAVVADHFSVELIFSQNQLDTALDKCGYYPLITNKPKEELSIHDAMMAHKNQYKIEHTNRRAKSGFSLEPIYLQTPERIEAFLLLFKTALQVIVLIERTARKNIEERNKGLDNFMPNKKDVRNPRTEYLLSEFQYLVKGHLPLPDGKTYGFVSTLNQLQQDILNLLEVPTHCYSYSYVTNTS